MLLDALQFFIALTMLATGHITAANGLDLRNSGRPALGVAYMLTAGAVSTVGVLAAAGLAA